MSDSTTSLNSKIDELQSTIKSLYGIDEGALKNELDELKKAGNAIKEDILASVSQISNRYKKTYRLCKNVHLYRALMIQEILVNESGDIMHYGDILMRGHSLSDITSGSGRTHASQFTRVALPDIEFIDVFGGHNVFYALPKDGNFLYVWGVNTSGCAGTGNTDNIPIPTRVSLNFRPKKILSGKSTATGKQTTLILSEDGKIYGAGTNTNGELGIGNNINTSTFTQSPYLKGISDLSFASNGEIGYALAIDVEGNLWAWGFNGSGNLGLNHTNTMTIPQKVAFSARITGISTSIGASNSATSFIVMDDSSVRAAGYNAQKQLSQSNTANSAIFLRVLKQGADDLSNIKQVFASAHNGTALALGNNGDVYSWGYGGYGFGDIRGGNNQMASIALENIESLVCTQDEHTRVVAKVKNAPILMAFGRNDDGALGLGNKTNSRQFVQVQLPNFSDYHLYSFGSEAKLIVLCDDEVYSCGSVLDGDINFTTSTLQKQS